MIDDQQMLFIFYNVSHGRVRTCTVNGRSITRLRTNRRRRWEKKHGAKARYPENRYLRLNVEILPSKISGASP